MEGWKTEKLGKICEMYQPQTIAASDLIPNGKYYVYGANGIIGKYDRYNHEQCELLMTCRGNTCGEITVSKPYSWINGNAMVIRPKTDNIKRDYIEHFLKFTRLASIITGGAQPQITRGDLKMLKITYPVSLSEQTAIAKILSTVDEAIRSTRETISKLERVKKALMQNLLSGKMKPDGTLRTATEFYEDDKMGLVPKGWKSVKLKEVGNIQTGKTPPTAQSNVFANSLSKGFMFITPGDLGDGKYITDSERYVTEKGIGYSYRLPKGSIAIVCIGSTIGKIGIVSTESCTNQQINAIIVNDMNNNEFLYYLMQYKTPHFKEIAGVNATPQINKSTFQKYRIILPIDKQEQCAIANKLSTIDSEINKKQEKITALESLKKSLMQQLLTGRVRVKRTMDN